MLHALLKHIGRGVYNVESGDDNCLLALGYFLTDGGSPDLCKSWIETTSEGDTTLKITFLEKFGDQMRVSLIPEMTQKKATLVTNKFELLNLIKRFNQLIVDKPAFLIIKRENGKILIEPQRAIHEGPMANFEGDDY